MSVVHGDNNNNTLVGTQLNDEICGFGGNDYLLGGAGNDTLWGGLGSDLLQGDAGTDRFVFESASEANGDWIMDFHGNTSDMGLNAGPKQNDKMDFSLIDANSLTPGDEAFTFIGTKIGFASGGGTLGGAPPFTGVGQLRWFDSEGNTCIQGNTDFDLSTAEFTIFMPGERQNKWFYGEGFLNVNDYFL